MITISKNLIVGVGLLATFSFSCRQLMYQERQWQKLDNLGLGEVYSARFDQDYKVNTKDRCNIIGGRFIEYKVGGAGLTIRCSYIPFIANTAYNPFKRQITYSYQIFPQIERDFLIANHREI